MLAAQLNDLGISQQSQQQNQSAQPEAPPRNNRTSSQGLPSKSSQNVQSNPLDPLDSSDSDSEPDEPNERVRNDGTLLASDPPKPLYVFVVLFMIINHSSHFSCNCIFISVVHFVLYIFFVEYCLLVLNSHIGLVLDQYPRTLTTQNPIHLEDHLTDRFLPHQTMMIRTVKGLLL